MPAMTMDEAVERSLEALRADPRHDGSWDEERAWRHIRDVTGIRDPARDGYLRQVADRVQLAVEAPPPRP